MITKLVLQDRVREWGLREDVVEKDYVLGWLLWGIGSQPELVDTWVFKGGTSLKKCYFETYRFSEDLDFTIVPGGPCRAEEVGPILKKVLARVAESSGLDFSSREPLLKTHSSGQYTEGRVYYTGPRNSPQVASVKLDLSASEVLAREPVKRTIAHPFPDTLPEPGTVLCYTFEEVFAEKIRAMGERSRPRDLYDIVNLFRRPDFRDQAGLILAVLTDKCQSKGVPIPTYKAIETSPAREELVSEWANMLGHQLPALPPLESFWDELKHLFTWLEGEAVAPMPSAVPLRSDEQPWIPPTTVTTWGTTVSLETVRFAGANHLCVRLGYEGSTQIIEPYSLRRTSDGSLVLHALRVDSGDLHVYRVDRIESINATSIPFTPRYAVEFLSSGPITAI